MSDDAITGTMSAEALAEAIDSSRFPGSLLTHIQDRDEARSELASLRARLDKYRLHRIYRDPPRFIPFEAMTDAEQVEHVEHLHGLEQAASHVASVWHRMDHAHGFALPHASTPHTHDKPTRRTA